MHPVRGNLNFGDAYYIFDNLGEQIAIVSLGAELDAGGFGTVYNGLFGLRDY